MIDVITGHPSNAGNGGKSATGNGNGSGTSSDRVTVALGSIFMGITCSVCGSDKVIRAGACGVCTECGTSQGCADDERQTVASTSNFGTMTLWIYKAWMHVIGHAGTQG